MFNLQIIYIAVTLRFALLLMNMYFAFEVSKKYKTYRLNVVLIIGIINMFSALGLIIEILHLFSAPEAIFTQIGLLYTLLGILVAYLVLIYLDLYENTHLNAYRLTVTTSLASFTFIANIKEFAQVFFKFGRLFGIVFSHIPLIFIGYTLYTGITTIKRMEKYANAFQTKLMSYVSYYVYFGFVGYSILQPVRNIIWSNSSVAYSTPEQIWVLIIPAIMLLVGNVFLYLGYIQPKQPSALSPQKIDRFIIITDQGIPVFNFEFDINVRGYDETLLSGALSAITAVLKEATNIAGDLRLIEIGNQNLLLRKSGILTGIIFTCQPTSFLKSLLTSLMIKIDSMYNFDAYGQFTEESFNQILDTTKNSFGYF